MTANGPLMARDDRIAPSVGGPSGTITSLARAFTVERVTRIELAWPAWKAGALPLSYTRVSVMILKRQGRSSISRSRGDRTRTCDLLLPKQTR
jgi:hypothetical protein